MRAREVTRDGSLVAGKWEERVCKVCELVGQVVEACTNSWGEKQLSGGVVARSVQQYQSEVALGWGNIG